ncbi:MAG: hypothetical protein DRP54_01945 [Spirochaetes bacterium]|nr:MAG: hypothetical protein DRP54_01945 [Spirochaetota bacterium]
MIEGSSFKNNQYKIPNIVTEEVPGPRSRELYSKASEMKGFSSQVKLFPVAFESGDGFTLRDVDGNTYLDFASGIYVTSLGHAHPKVSEAVAKWAKKLMNVHDFLTPIKAKAIEKIMEVLPDGYGGIQFYSEGSTVMEAGLRACRLYTGKNEFISCFTDFHGKTGHAVSLGRLQPANGVGRAQGFYMVPRPNPYRPYFTDDTGKIDTDKYLQFYDDFILEGTTGNISAFVLEPIQGWAGTVVPPDDFFPKLKEFLEKREILLFADEILTGMGRTGKFLCMEHWDVKPDIIALGKSIGNGFPVTALVVKDSMADSLDKISASTSYGGNPMACAAIVASIEVIQEERLLEHALKLGEYFNKRMNEMKENHPIVGDVRGKGCLLGIELVKDRDSKEPFEKAGKMVYKKAFSKGLVWVPSRHVLRLSPPIIIPEKLAAKGMDIIEESIYEVEKELGYIN